MNFRACALLLGLSFFAVSRPAFALDKPFDHSLFDQCLKRFVTEDGDVDFDGLRRDPALLDGYLKVLDAVDSRDFRNWPREERLALLINTYHAGVLSTIVRHPGIKSIQEIPGIWDLGVVELGGELLSLNTIRKHLLVQVFRDEKIHTALYCGAKSCPRLQRDAFTGPRAEGQLFLGAQAFVNDGERNLIDPDKKKVRLSKIFKWYAQDFKLDFGSAENELGFPEQEYAVISFVAHYLGSLENVTFLQEGRYKIKYLPFDWSLNQAPDLSADA